MPNSWTDLVSDGHVQSGFSRYYRREDDTGVSIRKKQRMHRFGQGYEDRGSDVSVTRALSAKDARAVVALLSDWFDQQAEDVDPDPDKRHLSEYLDALGGELDTLGLLQDLYNRDDVTISWSSYVLPASKDELAGKRVIDTYREYKDEMPDRQLDELYARIQDERNRRRSRERRGESDEE